MYVHMAMRYFNFHNRGIIWALELIHCRNIFARAKC